MLVTDDIETFERLVLAAVEAQTLPPTPYTRAECDCLVKHGFQHLATAGPHRTRDGTVPAIGTHAEQMRIAMNPEHIEIWRRAVKKRKRERVRQRG